MAGRSGDLCRGIRGEVWWIRQVAAPPLVGTGPLDAPVSFGASVGTGGRARTNVAIIAVAVIAVADVVSITKRGRRSDVWSESRTRTIPELHLPHPAVPEPPSQLVALAKDPTREVLRRLVVDPLARLDLPGCAASRR